MKQNLVEVLGIQGKEDIISNILCYSLNNCDVFRNDFLKCICELTPEKISKIDNVTAKNRVSTRSGVPDICVLVTSSDSNEIVVIENKLLADEGWMQTERYASNECKEDLSKAFNVSNPQFRFIYLSLFHDNTAQHPAFITKHYDELLDNTQVTKYDDLLSQQLLGPLFEVYDKFYTSAVISDQDNLIDKLNEESDLNTAYAYFKSFFSSLSLPDGIKLKFTFNMTGQGRHYFGAQFSKDDWEPSEYNNSQPVLSRDTFSIHFEPQYNVLSGILNFYIHYEPNPYMPVRKIKNAPGYKEYLHTREAFIIQFHQISQRIQLFKPFNGSNQIGKIVIDLTDSTLKETKVFLERIMTQLCSVIDESLSR